MFCFHCFGSTTHTAVGKEAWNKFAGENAAAFGRFEFTGDSFDDATLSIIGGDGFDRLGTVDRHHIFSGLTLESFRSLFELAIDLGGVVALEHISTWVRAFILSRRWRPALD